MYMVKITTDKLSSISENVEKMLRYGGKVMQCIDELQREGGEEMGERLPFYPSSTDGSRYGYRSYGMRGGMRGGEDPYGDDMGERRGRRY